MNKSNTESEVRKELTSAVVVVIDQLLSDIDCTQRQSHLRSNSVCSVFLFHSSVSYLNRELLLRALSLSPLLL